MQSPLVKIRRCRLWTLKGLTEELDMFPGSKLPVKALQQLRDL